MSQVWLSAAGLSIATVIGALIGFGIKELPHKWNDAVLGFCAPASCWPQLLWA